MNRHYNNGNIEAAQRASDQAVKTSALAHVCGLIIIIVVVFLLMSAALMALFVAFDWSKTH